MSERNWLNQFGADYDVPAIITSALNDQSWGNDMCPSFGLTDPQVTLWVDHPLPAAREIQGNGRFLVVVYSADRDTEISSFETDDAAAALQRFNEIHAHRFTCPDCKRSFADDECNITHELHGPYVECPQCNHVFAQPITATPAVHAVQPIAPAIEPVELQVCKELLKLGVGASYEHPGYIAIAAGFTIGWTWNIGTANRDTWGGELTTAKGEIIAAIDFFLPPTAPAHIVAYSIHKAVRG